MFVVAVGTHPLCNTARERTSVCKYANAKEYEKPKFWTFPEVPFVVKNTTHKIAK